MNNKLKNSLIQAYSTAPFRYIQYVDVNNYMIYRDGIFSQVVRGQYKVCAYIRNDQVYEFGSRKCRRLK